MKVKHQKPAGWVDTGEVGLVQPSSVADMVHVIELEEGDLLQGFPGADGAPGVQGLPGADGAPGAQGLPGADGAPGAQGLPGADGAPGAQGLPGADGAPGAQGLPGADGAPGAQGLPGADGAPGAQGLPGLKGDKGDIGPGGYNGVAQSLASAVLSGFYRLHEPADKPAGSANYGQVFVSQGADTIAQIYVDYSSGFMYSRGGVWVGGAWTWSAWVMAGVNQVDAGIFAAPAGWAIQYQKKEVVGRHVRYSALLVSSVASAVTQSFPVNIPPEAFIRAVWRRSVCVNGTTQALANVNSHVAFGDMSGGTYPVFQYSAAQVGPVGSMIQMIIEVD